MPIKGSGAPELTEIDRRDDGVGWLAYPDETMQRASHALATDEGVYVVDPVDVEGVDELLAEFGDVAGVLVLLDRHLRDSAVVANRHDVPVYIPAWMTGVASKLDAPVERLGDELGDTGFDVIRVVDNAFWQEAALYRESDGTLLVPESLGTVDYFRTNSERVGVHPFRRLTPPRKLQRLTVNRLLVGHGAGIDTDADAAVEDAVKHAQRRAPFAMLGAMKDFITG
ncbi:hypothetical protein [Halorarius litoreus]|uniref:hypothetical protein n=1 Tax=Halorarius litoreus TaxID=2962676 RepID=UPI0020CDAD5B|nr:hypothetical protein [Halorarius litoreus]